MMLVTAIFIYWHVVNLSFVEFFKKYHQYLSNIIAGIIALICALLVMDFLAFSALVIEYIIIGFIINDLLKVILKKIKSVKLTFILNNALIVLVLLGSLLGYGYYNAKQMQTTSYQIKINKKYSINNLKIAFISDIHLGTFYDADKLNDYLKTINNHQVDLILLGGDIFDEHTRVSDFKKACKQLGELTSTYGTYYVYGNHEIANYNHQSKLKVNDISRELTKNHIRVLKDETILIANKFYLIGRDDFWSYGRHATQNAKPRADIKTLVKNTDQNKYKIVLDHQPIKFKTNKASGVNLQLSGHTHGGQHWPNCYISQLFSNDDLQYGLQEDGDFNGVVTSGMAGWGYPIRTHSHNEIVFITLIN